MRIANLSGRLVLLHDGRALDVETASGRAFSSDPQAIYPRWADFLAWAQTADLEAAEPYDDAKLGAPAPRPAQVFAMGLNYALHAREAGYELPEMPLVFTKFPSCITGPNAVVAVATDRVDWEVELVAVIGRRAHKVSPDDAWSYVAGVTVGQDISARDVQMRGAPPQFSLGKSFPGFGPTGPWLVTPDELPNRDDLEIGCAVNGEQRQLDRTASLMFDVRNTIAGISEICPLLPGDLVFTGTPSGVGNRMDPPTYLKPGDALVSTIEGIGSITTRFEAP
jgi:2,4-diketo-3-deoxy-L-fuconate hydrolase